MEAQVASRGSNRSQGAWLAGPMAKNRVLTGQG